MTPATSTTKAATPVPSDQTPAELVSPGGAYARYALVILTIVYILNFIDRQILSILAEDIKADLKITDAQIGFLYGTAFAIFYAIFGIPLGRLADLWVRTRLIAIGLSLWSLMTMLSGTARGLTSLGFYRLGVGVGEATANPATYSLLSDYFPPSVRTLVISIFSSGGYIGLGVGVYLGAAILDGWNGMYSDPALAPFGLKGWQVAFFAVGLPGLLMALAVAALKEPVRGGTEGIVTDRHPQPFGETFRELITIMPPITLYGLWAAGYRAGGIAVNLLAAATLAALATVLTILIAEPQQWIALGIGIYAVFSWAQSLRLRDPPTFVLLFRSRAFVLSAIGFPCLAFVSYGFSFWTAPLLIRAHGVTASDVGPYIGAGLAIGGWAGVTLGGMLADRLEARYSAARHLVGLISAALTLPSAALVLYLEDLTSVYVAFFVMIFFLSLWFGPCYSSVVDLVLPRMRAIATALMIFMATVLGLAVGPFTIGRLSDAFVANGATPANGLRLGMLVCLGMTVVGFALIWLARNAFEHDVAHKVKRARAAGERI